MMEGELLQCCEQPPPADFHLSGFIIAELGLQRASDDSRIGSTGSSDVRGSGIFGVQSFLGVRIQCFVV
jgi:hypothetical protein